MRAHSRTLETGTMRWSFGEVKADLGITLQNVTFVHAILTLRQPGGPTLKLWGGALPIVT